MSYLSKSSELEDNSIIWPGFVDVLASTLMVIIFIVLLFTVSQVYLGDLVVGKNEEIQNLENTIDIQDETIVYQDDTLTDTQKNILEKEIIISKMIEPPALIELASEAEISLKKLKEGFKQVYGASVYAFLLDYKMQVSKRLLSSKNYNVNEVALKVGYSTATHFINAFKKKFGTTPKKYLMSI